MYHSLKAKTRTTIGTKPCTFLQSSWQVPLVWPDFTKGFLVYHIIPYTLTGLSSHAVSLHPHSRQQTKTLQKTGKSPGTSETGSEVLMEALKKTPTHHRNNFSLHVAGGNNAMVPNAEEYFQPSKTLHLYFSPSVGGGGTLSFPLCNPIPCCMLKISTKVS